MTVGWTETTWSETLWLVKHQTEELKSRENIVDGGKDDMMVRVIGEVDGEGGGGDDDDDDVGKDGDEVVGKVKSNC